MIQNREFIAAREIPDRSPVVRVLQHSSQQKNKVDGVNDIREVVWVGAAPFLCPPLCHSRHSPTTV